MENPWKHHHDPKWYDVSILFNLSPAVGIKVVYSISISVVHQPPEILQHIEAHKRMLPSKSTIYIVRFLVLRWEIAIRTASIPWGSHQPTTMSLLRKLGDNQRKQWPPQKNVASNSDVRNTDPFPGAKCMYFLQLLSSNCTSLNYDVRCKHNDIMGKIHTVTKIPWCPPIGLCPWKGNGSLDMGPSFSDIWCSSCRHPICSFEC